jgi:hypothetical protein
VRIQKKPEVGRGLLKLVGWRRQYNRGDKTKNKNKNWRGRTFFRVIASAVQKLAVRSKALCTGYCGELSALSHLLSVFSFPISCPEGAVGRGGVIATPAAVSLVSRCHNRTVETIYRPPLMMAVL